MGIARRLASLHRYPPSLWPAKLGHSLRRRATLAARRLADRHRSTYLPEGGYTINSIDLGTIGREFMGPRRQLVEVLCRHAMAHCFDILGSGWQKVVRETDPQGSWLANHVSSRNLAEAQRVWRAIEPPYEGIDWHVDFKSGHRWASTTWYAEVSTQGPPGADIKVPWELARAQHLPVLAQGWLLGRLGLVDATFARSCAREVRNQILDFIASNPPRFGVNWRGTMDVAIRLVNWMLAYDLLQSSGYVPDMDFTKCLGRSAHEHFRHIKENLDDDPFIRGNHYLADLVGLLVGGAHLARSPDVDQVLAHAAEAFAAETSRQFLPDGFHFESSTSYHRLCAEMLIYGTAAFRRLWSDGRVTGFDSHEEALVDRISRAAAVIAGVASVEGRMPQIGDNDSGRLVKVTRCASLCTRAELERRYVGFHVATACTGDALYPDEDESDHRHILAAAAALARTRDAPTLDPALGFEELLVARFAAARGPAPLRARHRLENEYGNCARWHSLLRQLERLPEKRRRTMHYPLPAAGGSDLVSVACPDFGLYVMRSQRHCLSVRCGRVRRETLGAHAHLDQLSVILEVDGRRLCDDPGTFLYSADPQAREHYRSAESHGVPLAVGGACAVRVIGLFELRGALDGECLWFGNGDFAGVHHLCGVPVYRYVRSGNSGVDVFDYSPERELAVPREAAPAVSPAYGRRLRQ